MKKIILMLIIFLALLSSCKNEEKNNISPLDENIVNKNNELKDTDMSLEDLTSPTDETENNNNSSLQELTPPNDETEDNKENESSLTIGGCNFDDDIIQGPPVH